LCIWACKIKAVGTTNTCVVGWFIKKNKSCKRINLGAIRDANKECKRAGTDYWTYRAASTNKTNEASKFVSRMLPDESNNLEKKAVIKQS
jgi:hypothetical protein